MSCTDADHSSGARGDGNDAAGGDFTDYHSLIKIDGKRKVVAKLFHLREK